MTIYSESYCLEIDLDGNYNNKRFLKIDHSYFGAILEPKYCEETLKHICFLWGRDVVLKTSDGKKEIFYRADAESMEVKTWEEK